MPKFKAVEIRVVLLNFNYFGNGATSRPPLQVDDNV